MDPYLDEDNHDVCFPHVTYGGNLSFYSEMEVRISFDGLKWNSDFAIDCFVWCSSDGDVDLGARERDAIDDSTDEALDSLVGRAKSNQILLVL